MPSADAPRRDSSYPASTPAPWIRDICLIVLVCTVLLGCPPRTRRGNVTCAAGQELVCLNRCAPASGPGGPCVPGRNECSPGYRACRGDLACNRLENNPSEGVCEQPPSIFCDPAAPAGSAANLCADGFFCRKFGTPEEVANGLACLTRPRLDLREDQMRGICTAGLPEGAACGGEWARALRPLVAGQQPFCAGCAPGLVCWNGRCRRPCLPGEGGLENCIPDEETQLFATRWECSVQTGNRALTGTSSTMALCTVCVPHLAPCQLRPELLQQLRPPGTGRICCDADDTCARALDLSGVAIETPATCCRGHQPLVRLTGASAVTITIVVR